MSLVGCSVRCFNCGATGLNTINIVTKNITMVARLQWVAVAKLSRENQPMITEGNEKVLAVCRIYQQAVESKGGSTTLNRWLKSQ